MSPGPRREEIARYGRRGRRIRVVRGVLRSAKVIWVEYRGADGKRAAKVYPPTRAGKLEAVQFAEGLAEGQQRAARPAAPRRYTTAELWAAYVEAEFPPFRPATVRIYRDGWKPWEAFVGSTTIAEDLGRDSMAGLRAELDRRGWAVNTIRKTFGVIRAVYKWGFEGDLLSRNRVASYIYKVAKDKRPVSPAEFRMEEFAALLEALPLDEARGWRGHTVLGVCGHQGARQWAVLHLQWTDIDVEAGLITWRAEWDKNGKEWQQPLREPTKALLAVALQWREEAEYEGPWVFFPATKKNKGEVYTEQSLSRALRRAEAKAGIVHIRGRGPHGLRRLLAGEMHELTGSLRDAMDAIGDKDIKQAERYVKTRMDRLRRNFDALDARLKEGAK